MFNASSVMPMMPFIGVRISWLMLARNSLLARLASSAISLAAVSSRVRSRTLWSRSSVNCCSSPFKLSRSASDCASSRYDSESRCCIRLTSSTKSATSTREVACGSGVDAWCNVMCRTTLTSASSGSVTARENRRAANTAPLSARPISTIVKA